MSMTSVPGYWELVDQIERGERIRVVMAEDEFLAWADEKTRAEWVDGEVIIMSPPSIDHVRINGLLGTVFRTHVEAKDLGQVLGPEAPVRLTLPDGRVRRRVPDLLFIQKSRMSIVQTHHTEGPPDAVVEIVSPESQSRDRRIKYLEYEQAGVREYWIVDPLSRRVEAYRLGDAGAYEQIVETDGVIRSSVIEGFFIRSQWLWTEPRPTTLAILKELGLV